MAYTTPTTAVSGATLTAAVWNASVRDNFKALGDAPTSYTPAIGGTGWSIGSTGSAATGYYTKAGSFVVFYATLTFGTVGATFGGAQATISLPATAYSGAIVYADGVYYDSSANATYRALVGIGAGSSVASLSSNASPVANVISTVPFTWAAGDIIRINGTYWAA